MTTSSVSSPPSCSKIGNTRMMNAIRDNKLSAAVFVLVPGYVATREMVGHYILMGGANLR